MSRRDDEDAVSAFDSTPYKAEWTNDGHTTEESLYAWLDGALDASDSGAIDAHVRTCRECAAAVAEARGFIAASVRIMNAADLAPQNTQRHVVSPAEVSRAAARIVALADSDGVIAGGASVVRTAERSVERTKRAQKDANPGHTRERRWHQHTLVRIAAGVLLLVGGSYVLTRGGKRSAAGDITYVASNSTPAVSAKAASVPDTTRALKATVVATVEPVDSVDRVKKRTSVAKVSAGNNAQLARRAPATRAPTSRPDVAQVLPGVNIQATVPSQSVTKSTFATTVVTVEAVDLQKRRNITGTVTDRGTSTPLSAANVYVNGTTQVVTTDAAGNFTLKDIPADVQSVMVRRLGYMAATISLDSLRASGSMNVSLASAPMMLNAMTVTSISDAQGARGAAGTTKVPAASSARNALCFVAITELSGDFVPLVRSVHATLQKSGLYQATLAGWPNAGDEKRAMLTLDAEGALRGSVQAGGNRLELLLVPRGDDWFSTLDEYRGANVRRENIRYRSDTVATKCR